MRKHGSAAALILAAGILAACSQAPELKQDTRGKDRAVAERAAAELISTLKRELKTAMRNDGPAEAVAVCSTRAQALTAAIPGRINRPDITIQRTSLKFRNTANRPTHEEKLILQQFARQLNKGKTLQPLTVKTAAELRYYHPLQAAPLCLNCHGKPEGMHPEVRALLRRYYPDDRATGFAAGDLRGMISITVPAGSH